MAISDTLGKLLDKASPDPAERSLGYTYSGETERVQPDFGDIEDYVEDYEECPLVHVPIDNYSSDVLAPGYRVEAKDSDADLDVSTVSGVDEDELDDAVEAFLENAAIRAARFGQDFGKLLEDQVEDSLVRGDGVAEIVYDDREKQTQILGFRLLPKEDLTAYTRARTGILHQPDDKPAEKQVGSTVREAPKTPAGKTAAFVQDDNVFSDSTDSEAAFSLDSIVRVVHDPDTGEVWGRSILMRVHPRVRNFLQKLEDVDEAIAAKAYTFWLIKLGSEENPKSEETARDFMDKLKPEEYSPGQKQAVPGDTTIDTVEGDVPEVWDSFSFDVKYILSEMPSPKFQTAFNDQINRDIVEDKKDDYEDRVENMRQRLASAWTPVVNEIAGQLYDGDAEEAPDVELVLEPEDDASPLTNQNFDPEEFKQLMNGLAKKKGTQITDEALVEHILKMDPDEVMPDDPEPAEQIREDDERVQRAMDQIEQAGGEQPPPEEDFEESGEEPPQDDAQNGDEEQTPPEGEQ